ncbi:MAG: hypothetical protein O2923_00740 [Verrucomicrobia bacterium]|nr:hypothetical protein [Verrucomicrobiota bacterium]
MQPAQTTGFGPGDDRGALTPAQKEQYRDSIHHKRVVHGAFENAGAVRRVAMAQHYAAQME